MNEEIVEVIQSYFVDIPQVKDEKRATEVLSDFYAYATEHDNDFRDLQGGFYEVMRNLQSYDSKYCKGYVDSIRSVVSRIDKDIDLKDELYEQIINTDLSGAGEYELNDIIVEILTYTYILAEGVNAKIKSQSATFDNFKQIVRDRYFKRIKGINETDYDKALNNISVLYDYAAKTKEDFEQCLKDLYSAVLQPSNEYSNESCSRYFITIKDTALSLNETVFDDNQVARLYEVRNTNYNGLPVRERMNMLISIVRYTYLVAESIKDKLARILESDAKSYDFTEYCKKVISEYSENRVKHYVPDYYIPTLWTESTSNNRYLLRKDENLGVFKDSGQDSELIREFGDKIEGNIRFVGPAGYGKTWAMIHLQGLLCEEYLKGSKEEKYIPVLIELSGLNIYKEDSIRTLVKSTMGIKEDAVFEQILEYGKIVFMFDGYNEVIEEKAKQDIRSFVTSYKNRDIRFIFSDREEKKTQGIFEGFSTYKVEKFRENQVRLFFERRNPNECQQIISSMKDGGKLNWLYQNGVLSVAPYVLEVLSELAKSRMDDYPGKNEFDKRYLHFLLLREEGQKSQEKLKNINRCLRSVAKYLDENNMESIAYNLAEGLFKEELERELLGNKELISVSRYISWALEIPILELFDNGQIRFSNENYIECFKMGEDSIIDIQGYLK